MVYCKECHHKEKCLNYSIEPLTGCINWDRRNLTAIIGEQPQREKTKPVTKKDLIKRIEDHAAREHKRIDNWAAEQKKFLKSIFAKRGNT